MFTYSYEVFYKDTPENKHRGSIKANTPTEAKEMLRAKYHAYPIEINLTPNRVDDDVAAFVVNNGSGICRPGFLDPDAPLAVFPK
ncbi:hypothetical protein [Pseudomonas sp. LB3P31]